jgi:predicted acylesterase/phospholipase RssA
VEEDLVAALADPQRYASPARECDIVMKGGITSGVIYPLAVCELAGVYRLRNIGGTSAGAIAATAAAAAEYGRHSELGGFPKLTRLPNWLGESAGSGRRSNLSELFQTTGATAPLLALVKAATRNASRPVKLAGTLWQLLRGGFSSPSMWVALVALAPAVLLAALTAQLAPNGLASRIALAALAALCLLVAAVALVMVRAARQRLAVGLVGVAALFGLVWITMAAEDRAALWLWVLAWLGLLLGLLVGAVASLLLHARRAIPANHYGLCTGYVPDADPPALTEWLTAELNAYAGLADRQAPLTFADLWTGPEGPREGVDRTPLACRDEQLPRSDPPPRVEPPHINLEMQTTCLSQGRPYRLPSGLATPSDRTNAFFYSPQELERFFPASVVQHLGAYPPAAPRGAGDRREWALLCELLAPLRPLPPPADLPVVVAARMSLSFPILISAVPLWTVDWTRRANQEAWAAWRTWQRQGGTGPKPTATPQAERCWFSDGGITSNFPVHFFDQPLPYRPTFGINLRPFHPDHPRQPQECDNIWMPKTNLGGQREWWTRWDRAAGFGRLTGFLHAIADTMQNWSDNTQLRVPGYRDRVVHVSHTDSEGGINLDMDAGAITAMSQRGACAGRRLVDYYTTPPEPPGRTVSWENHRWVRYRSTMSILEGMFRRLHSAYTRDQPADHLDYLDVSQLQDGELPSYRWNSDQQRALSVELTGLLSALGQRWDDDVQQQPHTSLIEDAPSPVPEFRITPGQG